MYIPPSDHIRPNTVASVFLHHVYLQVVPFTVGPMAMTGITWFQVRALPCFAPHAISGVQLG